MLASFLLKLPGPLFNLVHIVGKCIPIYILKIYFPPVYVCIKYCMCIITKTNHDVITLP